MKNGLNGGVFWVYESSKECEAVMCNYTKSGYWNNVEGKEDGHRFTARFSLMNAFFGGQKLSKETNKRSRRARLTGKRDTKRITG